MFAKLKDNIFICLTLGLSFFISLSITFLSDIIVSGSKDTLIIYIFRMLILWFRIPEMPHISIFFTSKITINMWQIHLLHQTAILHTQPLSSLFPVDSWTCSSKISPLSFVRLPGNRRDEANHPDRKEGRGFNLNMRNAFYMQSTCQGLQKVNLYS